MVQRHFRLVPVAAAIAFMGAFGPCGRTDNAVAPPAPEGTEPQTYFTRGPADSSNTNYRVRIGWGAVLEAGEVDHYEFSWETPSNWSGPVTSPESLFTTSADMCCTTVLPEFAGIAEDSTYSAFHTLYVRAVSKGGLTDQTPIRISFNSKSVAPSTDLLDATGTDSPDDEEELGCPDPIFYWSAVDLDGEIASYEYLLTSNDAYRNANGTDPATFADMIAWIQTMPLASWATTTETSRTYVALAITEDTTNQHVFAVRAIDNSGNRELVLDPSRNVRRVEVNMYENGPTLTVRALSSTNQIIGTWPGADPDAPLLLSVNQGVRFEFLAVPRPSVGCRPIAGYSHKSPDLTAFTPFEELATGFPTQDQLPGPELWRPQAVGDYELIVRVIDSRDFVAEVSVPITVN